MKPTFEQFSDLHNTRNAIASEAWYAARKLAKEERKIERLMIDLATKVARDILTEWEHGAAL